MLRGEALDKILLLLVSGVTVDEIEVKCPQKFQLGLDIVKELIIDARRQITIAADYNRVDEIGTAYIRLNDIYKRSINIQDMKTALAAQKELNKLLDLYKAITATSNDPDNPDRGDRGDRGGGSLSDMELAAVKQHLLSLQLAPEDYPVSEHARIASELIRKNAVTNSTTSK